MSDKKLKKQLDKIKKRGEQQKQIHEAIEAYSKYFPDKKQKKVSNIMLVIIVIAIVGYACANFFLQYNMGMEISSTLTTCWYSFWGVEIAALSAIKVTKVRNDGGEISYSDDDENCG